MITTTVHSVRCQSTVHSSVVDLDHTVPAVGTSPADTAEPVADTAKLAALPNTVVLGVDSTADVAAVADIADTGRAAAAGACSSPVAVGVEQELTAADQEMADIARAWRIVG